MNCQYKAEQRKLTSFSAFGSSLTNGFGLWFTTFGVFKASRRETFISFDSFNISGRFFSALLFRFFFSLISSSELSLEEPDEDEEDEDDRKALIFSSFGCPFAVNPCNGESFSSSEDDVDELMLEMCRKGSPSVLIFNLSGAIVVTEEPALLMLLLPELSENVFLRFAGGFEMLVLLLSELSEATLLRFDRFGSEVALLPSELTETVFLRVTIFEVVAVNDSTL